MSFGSSAAGRVTGCATHLDRKRLLRRMVEPDPERARAAADELAEEVRQPRVLDQVVGAAADLLVAAGAVTAAETGDQDENSSSPLAW